ncbi:hypothetical protein ACTPC6_18125 [Clostridioides difficile]
MTNNKKIHSKDLEKGKALKFIDTKFNLKVDCIITYISKSEITLLYYDKELNDIAYRSMTMEDLNFGDYKFELLS